MLKRARLLDYEEYTAADLQDMATDGGTDDRVYRLITIGKGLYVRMLQRVLCSGIIARDKRGAWREARYWAYRDTPDDNPTYYWAGFHGLRGSTRTTYVAVWHPDLNVLLGGDQLNGEALARACAVGATLWDD